MKTLQTESPSWVHIPETKQKATVGYSVEALVKVLDGVTNSQVDVTGTTKPLLECITSGVIRGAVAMVGCNNPEGSPGYRSYRADEENDRKRHRDHCLRLLCSGCSKGRSDGQGSKGSLRRRLKESLRAGRYPSRTAYGLLRRYQPYADLSS